MVLELRLSVQITFSCQLFCLALSVLEGNKEVGRGSPCFLFCFLWTSVLSFFPVLTPGSIFQDIFFPPYFGTSLITPCKDASSSWLISNLVGVLACGPTLAPGGQQLSSRLDSQPAGPLPLNLKFLQPSIFLLFSDSKDKGCLCSYHWCWQCLLLNAGKQFALTLFILLTHIKIDTRRAPRLRQSMIGFLQLVWL